MPRLDNEKYLEAIALRQKYPCMAGSAIARHLGISRQRVHQMLGAKNRRFIQEYECMNCHNTYTPYGHNHFCSRECYLTYSNITLKCSWCGKQFTIRRSTLLHRIKYSHPVDSGIYCSKHCAMLGVWRHSNAIQPVERKPRP